MPLTIQLREKTTIPVEVDSIRMETVRTQSADQVRATLIQNGNRQVELGEFFDVSGSATDDEVIIWEGDCSHVKLIGTHLASGTIRVEGHAGMHLGAEMTGGEITVTGDVGDWAGAEMHGGRIRIYGDAGHLVGAAYRGGSRGMTGGEILIDGSAGNEIGHSMRRGLIVVGGCSGDAPGVGMIAGSILLLGKGGIRPGPGMKRGTILFADAATAPEILPAFHSAGVTRQPVFLQLFWKHLAACGFKVPADLTAAAWQRHIGDFLELGKGEILIRSDLN
ncbi:formylmethanofuran dehydrogenase subunit C [bacterium]|nr:formylmethanofuran dehydrogenase subunit C [bacterium]